VNGVLGMRDKEEEGRGWPGLTRPTRVVAGIRVTGKDVWWPDAPLTSGDMEGCSGGLVSCCSEMTR
jgi:hypothetical protein